MNNLVQKWIIYHPRTQSFVTNRPFNYTSDPNLARIYHNYSDAIMACNNHYDREFDKGHYPIELRMHFNTKTLLKETNTDE
jgi:alpha-galactosidase